MWQTIRNRGIIHPVYRVSDLQKKRPDMQKLQKPQPVRPRRIWVQVVKWLVVAGVACAAIGIGTVAFVFWLYGRDPKLPNLEKLGDYHPKQVITILDANDRRVGELFTERRTFVPYDKIPPVVVDAFIAAEDNHFWTHGGIDYVGMMRAFVANIRAGHTRQGASTITQQVVKTFLLTPENGPRLTFKQKIQEIILARRLEKSFSKEEILTLYLNQIYFGRGRYGIQEAARFYFGKDVGQLNVGEAAMLASLPKDPEPLGKALVSLRTSTQVTKGQVYAKERQSYVLDQMVVIGKLTQAEADKWKAAKIQIIKEPFPELGSAPEWVDLVRKQLVADKGEAALDQLGGTVRTTLDPGMQAMAQRALQAGLRAVDKRHGVARAVRTIKPDKIAGEITRLGKKLAGETPKPKQLYDAVVTAVHDDDDELELDLGNWPASIKLGGEADARFNPADADGNLKKPSERFKVGDVVQVTVPTSATKKVAADGDDTNVTTEQSRSRRATNLRPRSRRGPRLRRRMKRTSPLRRSRRSSTRSIVSCSGRAPREPS